MNKVTYLLIAFFTISLGSNGFFLYKSLKSVPAHQSVDKVTEVAQKETDQTSVIGTLEDDIYNTLSLNMLKIKKVIASVEEKQKAASILFEKKIKDELDEVKKLTSERDKITDEVAAAYSLEKDCFIAKLTDQNKNKCSGKVWGFTEKKEILVQK